MFRTPAGYGSECCKSNDFELHPYFFIHCIRQFFDAVEFKDHGVIRIDDLAELIFPGLDEICEVPLLYRPRLRIKALVAELKAH